MLRQTFLHIQGVGEATERRLWEEGLRSWDAVLASGRRPGWQAELEESIRRHNGQDWSYFDQVLPSACKWRAYPELAARTLYVDIETNGGMGPDDLTVLGTYDGTTCRAFVAERDLEEAADYLASFPLWITYNGALFDVPFIRRRFAYHRFNHIHVDLRYPLHRLGYRGGLKRIEQQLGVRRSERTRGLDGWDAVRLWRGWQDGQRGALDLLLDYNAEDVRNLKPLMELVHREMASRLAPGAA
jgi:uncharacterized protein YprB with RNaseH-like and TPR domain